jgi:sarcosine oxidase
MDPAGPGNFQGVYYGFPLTPDASGGVGLKVAHHFPASAVNPDEPGRDPTPADREEILTPLRRYLPQGLGPILRIGICMYTNSPDGHFILGPMPGQDRVTLACGFSGHGFKFVSVVGEILADLATTGSTRLPIEFLSPNRFQ